MKDSIETGGNDRSPMHNALGMIQKGFNFLNHFMIIFVAFYMTYVCVSAGNRAISWHAWLCTLGYQLMMTQSIMSLYAHNVWSKKQPRQVQKTIHWVFQAIGSTAAIAGMITEYVARENMSRGHFSSTHSIVGLTAGIFTLIGMCNGVSALWSAELRHYVRPAYFKLAHNLNGITAFVLGMVALFYGLDKHFVRDYANDSTRMCLQAFAIISIFLSLIGALRAALNLVRVAIFN